MPRHMDRIAAAVDDCAVFVSIGTSGTVYPAANLVTEARHNKHHAQCIELNLEETETSPHFHVSQQGKATVLVPRLVDAILDRK